jgi:1-aminocyclopropane-1-carboxylate deaminase/D-cysteine desulfhydrase-like pyridoxal-dependent ACC family enzyme
VTATLAPARRPRIHGRLAAWCVAALLAAAVVAAVAANAPAAPPADRPSPARGTARGAPDAPPLVRAFPSLARLPRVPLRSGAAPLEPLRALEGRVRAEEGAAAAPEPWLWIKRDDGADGLVGGNKARKLEYLLGEARARGARKVVTSGRYGTNLGLAAADAARRLGLAATVVLAPAPVTEDVRRKLLALHAAGAELRPHASLAGAIGDVAWLRLAAALRPRDGAHYIPPSGTSDVGSIGYVDAFFELLEQTGDAGLPDEIVVAASTGGTAAGLLAGICLSGRWGRTRVRAVGVTGGWLPGERLLRREARAAFRAVRDALDPPERARAVECDFDDPAALSYERGYVAPGYGRSDAALDALVRGVREAEGVELDVTFTAKAMRHFLDRARERLRAGDTRRRLVFWNTYAPVDVEATIRVHPWSDPASPWRDLPEPLRGLFEPPGLARNR